MERNRVHGAPWLEDVHALRARKGIDREGRLLLEGLRLTAAAWSAGVPFERAVWAPEHVGDGGATEALLARLRSQGVPCERLDARAFSKIFHTPTCAATREELLRSLSGRLVVVLAPDGDALDVGSLGAAARSMVVVLGNEKRGVHRDLARIATRRFAIPMRGVVDSLNVSHAAAIVLWEVFRRAA